MKVFSSLVSNENESCMDISLDISARVAITLINSFQNLNQFKKCMRVGSNTIRHTISV